MPQLKIFTHHDCARHEMGAAHPEQPARLQAVLHALEHAALLTADTRAEAPCASQEALLRVHPRDYIDHVYARAPHAGYVQLDPDTTMNAHSLNAALRAAGAGVAAVDWVMAGADRRAFCVVRPPGHHALTSRAMGFCIFANAAIAAKHALARDDVTRVAIVDFDVHHGNGTEECVADDARIRLYSTFQHPYYPHSGVPASAANIVNVPLAWGAGGREVRAAFQEKILTDMADFAPQVLLISAGFDAHRDDPLAGLNFEEDDYAWMTAQIVTQARASAQGRVVSLLEGGYDLSALARSATAHAQALSI